MSHATQSTENGGLAGHIRAGMAKDLHMAFALILVSL
jgi:hypothetical protein